MTIKERLENNIVFWTLAMLLAGFLAGIGTYKGVLEIAKLEGISKSELAGLRQGSLDTVSGAQKEALNRLVADRLQWSLQESEGKASGNDDERNEIQYKRLRKAVFLNLLGFQADSTILKDALESLNRRGHTFVAVHITRIVAEFPRIKAAKLRWLEDQAIPALRQDIELLRQSPVQRGAEASVVLPRIAWILDHAQGSEPEKTVQDMSLLEEEVAILKKTI